MSCPPDPPRPEEIVLVMRRAGSDRHGLRVRALIAVLWRGGLRISEALALAETDVDLRRGSLLVRHGKIDKRREAGMDEWGFEQLNLWLEHRRRLPVGPLFCVIDGPTRPINHHVPTTPPRVTADPDKPGRPPSQPPHSPTRRP